MTETLHQLLARRIALAGPVSVADYMAECLGHPVHGYYMTRDPFGRSGDFVTAPEISQMFGELLGAWAAVVWHGMGAPARIVLAELGPGRGTLMADALRATRSVPGFHQALDVVLVETSPVLRATQKHALDGHNVTWVDSVTDLPDGPVIFIANEFFDALPIRQFVFGEDRLWRERMIAVDTDNRLGWTLSKPVPLPVAAVPDAPEPGSVFEVNPAALAVASELADRIGRFGGAGLVLDYGHDDTGFADTLQAVRGHSYHPVLEQPGSADLTAHVDFGALSSAFATAGASVQGPVAQGSFLTALGLGQRAEILAASADEAQREAIGAAVQRLAAPEGMGRLFRALAITHPDQPVPPGFEPVTGGEGA